jgi:DNA-directed RNA polymerase specialized sigma24 family protein
MSVALRFTGNSEDAQDVAQSVFIILYHKAGRLDQKTILTGWLYEATRFTAMKLLRTKARQQVRETAAFTRSSVDDSNADSFLNKKYGVEEGLLMPMMAADQNKTYTGYTILSEHSPSADEMILEVQTEMVSAPAETQTLKFRRFGGDWKVVIDKEAMQKTLNP